MDVAPGFPIPYIGVTGVTATEEASGLAAIFSDLLGPGAASTATGMSGYLVSLGTLMGKLSPRGKFPPVALLPHLLEITATSAVNTIHYHTAEPQSLADQLTFLLSHDTLYERELCRTVQLNILWPEIEQLRILRRRFPVLQIILQLGPHIYRRESPESVALRLTHYEELTACVLLDPSAGAGRPFEAVAITPFFHAVSAALPSTAIALAGGFSDENVAPRLAELESVLGTRSFSIDAENALREPAASSANATLLSLPRTQAYVQQAAEFFAQ